MENDFIENKENNDILSEKTGKIGNIEFKEEKIPEEELIKIRKDKIFSYFKKKYNWIIYLLLAIIVYISVKIRTSNLNGLKDIVTGTWTLGPDLDPFLFLRYAKEIVGTGTLAAIDMFRYVPLGFETHRGFVLHYYLIAWFHKFLSPIFGAESVTHSAVLYPVFMFALTVIAFFLLVRKVFLVSFDNKKASAIALISSFFLTVMPVFLPRTIAGIPEKESAAFFFMFMAFYFFISSWNSKKFKSGIIYSILAGIFTAGMALIWGGYAFIFLVIGPSVFIAFIFGKIDKLKIYIYFLWLLTSFSIMYPFSAKYSIKNIFTSITNGISIIVLFIILIDYFIFDTKFKKYFKFKWFRKLPSQITSTIIAIIIVIILATIILGPSFIPSQVGEITNKLVKPSTSRLIQTVAENRQPYFTEWSVNFGPQVFNLSLTFWIFFIGSIYLFNYMMKNFRKKERVILTTSYLLFLISLVFSRYSSSGVLNGENFISLSIYFLGTLLFGGILFYYYYSSYKENEMDKFRNIDFGIIFVFIFFFLAIISARGLIRLVMVLVVPASIVIGYFAVTSYYSVRKAYKIKNYFILFWYVLIIISIIYAGFSLYNISLATAQSYVPSSYNQQWQKAMGWTRENTDQNAVFGHWWDYGYWVQSIGERATMLDGGNSISYWNHLMGRYGLTAPKEDKMQTLEFLYTHNITHFLIDSTDIGKYSAFSFIGSDENLDRRSWIPTFQRDNSQTVERKNSTLEIYNGGILIDEDIIYNDGSTNIFLPGNRAALGAILIGRDIGNKISSLEGIFVDQGKQYRIPMRYYFENELIDLGSGYEAGVFLFPKVNDIGGGQINIEEGGSMLYLSKRVVDSNLARNYLFDENNGYFELVHIESDFFVENLRSQGVKVGEFVDFRGFRGPIKIWEVKYPEDVNFNEDFLNTEYPESLRLA